MVDHVKVFLHLSVGIIFIEVCFFHSGLCNLPSCLYLILLNLYKLIFHFFGFLIFGKAFQLGLPALEKCRSLLFSLLFLLGI
ncbi:hypothetical protein F5882DRAFT_395902 [Hyaloscypha sp. PMI_1271]|nr:hypothetical protein F5882DRAFT_395902 [Hyaloscypha sp. PMI_1271]